MTKTTRLVFGLICALQLLFAVAFFLQWPPAIRLWPFAGTTPLTYVLLASFFAAAAASTWWPIFSRNDGALAGVGLDYAVILAPMAGYTAGLGLRGGGAKFYAVGAACLVGAIFGVWLFRWSRHRPLTAGLPMPPLVRWSFVAFIVALLYASTRLLLHIPTLPWPLTPELSTIAGCLFLGAAAYFVYGLLRPSWANAAGQLAGFLAYDLVLIVPLLARLPAVDPQFRASLIIYTIVVVYSGLLAIYYLFINAKTRLSDEKR